MQRYFKTREAAVRHLEVRRKAAYKRLAKKGQTIVDDRSHVFFNCLFKQMWTTCLLITTQELIDDLMNMTGIDLVQKNEAALIKDLSENISKDIVMQFFNSGKKNIQTNYQEDA